ncbi:MAG: hypothetical protein ACTSQE_12565 [Candidatus Heimdallarchaeaceae archaeon]
MAQNLGAFTPIKFALQLVKTLYNKTIYRMVTNTKYEGMIKDSGDTVTIRTAAKINLSAYTKGMTLVSQELNPTKEELKIDQNYYFKFIVDDIDKIQNDINAMSEYADNAKSDISELIDNDILSYAVKNVLGTNVIGGDYSTGTVAIDAAGAVTGSGTTFTAQMVGGYFQADGHTDWYLVTGYTSSTVIAILDLGGVAYSGGVIGAGASYEIAGATPIALTKSNIYSYLVELDVRMSEALTPKEGRFIVVNSRFEGLLRNAPEFIPAVESAYKGVVKEGGIGRIANLSVYTSELVTGDNTDGFYFWAGTKEYMAFALQILKTSVVSSAVNANEFVDTCKGLVVWGRKVCEGNRGRAAVLRATV